MDTHNCATMAFDEVFAEIGGQKVAVGAKQLKKAMYQNRVSRVYLAKNADPAITLPLAALCREHNTDCRWVRSMAELGRACGIEVGAAAAAALREQ